MKELLIKLRACDEAVEWAEGKSIEQIVEECDRGDWLLWLAEKIDIDFRSLTLAKGYCANTVRHLMKDERSVKSVDVAIAFGEDRATREELEAAADSAASAAVGNEAAYAAYAAASDCSSASTVAYAAYSAADREKNRLKTANICREYIGRLIIDKCNELNSKR